MKIGKIYFWILTCVLLCGCSDDKASEPDNPDERTPVAITTRAEPGLQANPLQAGLFMVNFLNGQHNQLLSSNNYVNNQLLTYSNDSWNTATPIYWNDMETHADFYAYAPYQESLGDTRQMPFCVQTNQNVDGALVQSDFLWGTIQDQSPTASSFDLTLAHQLSRLTVTVVAEQGFDDNELQASDVSVTLGGTKTNCVIDLATGEVTASGNAQEVQCCNNGDLSYTAVLIPQQVPFSNLIQIDWKGNKYTLQNSFLLEPKHQYSLTIKLKKTKSGFDIGISGWDIVDEDFGGVIGGN